jgi:citrate synthase
MRNIFGLFYDTSLLDAKTVFQLLKLKGITFREYTIPEVQEYAQKAEGGHEPLPESLFWLLMTGDFPSINSLTIFSQGRVRRYLTRMERSW